MSFEDFVITSLAIVGVWAILHFAVLWLIARGVINDDGRR